MQEYITAWKYCRHSKKGYMCHNLLCKVVKKRNLSVGELVIEDLLKQVILIPSLPEQQKIGVLC